MSPTEFGICSVLYVGLKISSVTRSRIVIGILHADGLCISYERILRVTQGLSESTLNLFEHEEAVIPGNLCTWYLLLKQKKTDKNSKYTISHYHGTSLSSFLFPSTVNLGEERQEKYVKTLSTESRKVRELPSFYTEFEEGKDPPEIFFSPVSTVNIPD